MEARRIILILGESLGYVNGNSSAAHISLRQGCISPVPLSDASFPTASIRHLSSFGLPLMAFFSFAALLAKSVGDTTV